MRVEVLEAEARAGPSARDSWRTPDSCGVSRASRAPSVACRPCRSLRALGTSGGGGGSGAARMFSSSHLPRIVGDVRVRVGRHRQHARLAEQAPAILVGERDAPEVAAVDARHAVVPRQLFVEERLVGRQQIDDAAVLLQLSVEKQLHLPDERDPQVVVEPGKLLVRYPASAARRCGSAATASKKFSHQRRARARVGEHAADLPIEHRRIAQLARGSPASSSSSSGMLLHRKNDRRDASSTIRQGDRRCPARRLRGRPRSGTGNPG